MIAAGYASARTVTQAHGRSFAFAAFALDKPRRDAAYAVYAFFRRLDDAFDNTGAGGATLIEARGAVAWLFGEERGGFAIWPADEMLALRDAIVRHRLPREPFCEMIAGMEMDLRGQRYPDEATLDLYCDRVAGTVGEIMARLLGSRDTAAAIALGRAMQLTNILRDVAEDRARGRVYLPQSLLAAYGVEALQPGERWRALAVAYVARARTIYSSARQGISGIDSFSGRWLVEMMSRIYGDILRAIEARDYDVFSGRARVSLARKLWLACGAFFSALRVQP